MQHAIHVVHTQKYFMPPRVVFKRTMEVHKDPHTPHLRVRPPKTIKSR